METNYHAVLSWLNRIGVKVGADAVAKSDDGRYGWRLTFNHPAAPAPLFVNGLETPDWRRSRAIYEALQWLTDAGDEADYPDYQTWADNTYGEDVATPEWWEMIVAAREFFNAVPGADANDLLYLDDLESGDTPERQEALLFLQGMESEAGL